MRFINSVYFKLIAFLLIGFILYLESFVNQNKDLNVFTAASRLVYEGKTCYEVWIKSGTSGLKYFYSPLFAVILFPIKDLPLVVSNLFWLSLNLVILYRIFRLLAFYLPLETLSPKKKTLFWFLVILSCARNMFDCFSLGQMTFVLLWASMESFRLIVNKQEIKGAALLALAINIKLIPVAVLAYLFYTKEWKAAIYTLAFFVLYLIIPSLFIGYNFNIFLHKEWLLSITATHAGSIMEDYGRQSLSAFIPALFMDTPIQFGIKRNFISLSTEQVILILTVTRLILLATIIYLFGKPLIKPSTVKKLFFHLSIICLATPLFFPHQGKYSFFYLLPAYAICLFEIIKNHEQKNESTRLKRTLAFTIVSFTLLNLTTDGLIGRHLSDLCEYLNLITIGSLSLLMALVTIKPVVASTATD